MKHHLANARSKVGAATTAQLVWILAPRLPEPEGMARTDESRLLDGTVALPGPREPVVDRRGAVVDAAGPSQLTGDFSRPAARVAQLLVTRGPRSVDAQIRKSTMAYNKRSIWTVYCLERRVRATRRLLISPVVMA